MRKFKVPVVLMVGQLAAGKSTVISTLKNLGAEIIKTDPFWQEVVYTEKNRSCLKTVFGGADPLNDDGSPNKVLLRSLLFAQKRADRDACAAREAALHREFDGDFFGALKQEIIRLSSVADVTMVVVENALGLTRKDYEVIAFDRIVSLTCSHGMRRERAIARKPLVPVEVIDAIMAVQSTDAQHLRMSECAKVIIVSTEVSEENLKVAMRNVYAQLMENLHPS